MGEIFLARLAGTAGFEKFCVIKKVLPALARDRAFVERFTGEARVLVRLTHGSIAQVLDMGDVDGEPYMALEFVDGKDLRRLLSRQRDAGTPVPVGLYVMGKVLEALAYAHRKRDEQDREIQLVHRDISPQNILLSYEGEVKVIDFGLAKSTLSDAKTNPSIILGKFLYMAPEQARHEKVDRRSDLYAVAMCLYEMLAGRHPFGQLGMTALMEAVMRPKVPPLQEAAPHLSDEVCQLVARGLEVDPARRFQAADEMRGALMAALLKLDPSAGPEHISAHMREAFTGEYAAERRLLQQLREAVPSPASAPPAETPWEATAVRRPAPASATETAEALVVAPLTAPPRARMGEDKTVPGVRLEDLEREAAEGLPPEDSAPPVELPSMLDEEPQALGGLTPPPTLAVQQPLLPEEPPASIEVSPELFADV
ncbi:MAG: protein kinase, partial [Deltaproteobacteria bacterium]|nr:protein kinase [Deltaproteobacteria bacterium]